MTLSGSFSDAGLKKLDTALFVVVVVILRLVGGGEMSRSVVLARLRDPEAICVRVVHPKERIETERNVCMQNSVAAPFTAIIYWGWWFCRKAE